MTKSIATDVTLTEYSYEAVEAAWVEAERFRAKRAPALAEAWDHDERLRAEARDLRARGECLPTHAPYGWAGFTALLVNAVSLSGQAVSATARGDDEASAEYFVEAHREMALAKAML